MASTQLITPETGGDSFFDSKFLETRTKLKTPENIALWQRRIQNQIARLSNHWNGYNSWVAAYLLDRTIHWMDVEGNDSHLDNASENRPSKATFPLISTHVRNLVPHLISEEPLFYAVPPSEELVDQTLFSMDYLNDEWRSRKLTKQLRRSILDAAIIGHAVQKTGWETTEEITEENIDEGKIHVTSSIIAEHPWAYRVNPFLFLFDTTGRGKDLDTARWCCEIIPKKVSDIINNPNYNKEVRQNLRNEVISVTDTDDFFSKHFVEGNRFLTDEYNVIYEDLKGEERALALFDMPIILYELWDKKFQVVYTLIHGYDEKALAVRDWPHPYLDGFPYVKFDFEEVPNESYGIGHAWYLTDTQRTMNRLKTKFIQIIENFNPMYIVKGEPLDPQEEDKLRRNELGSVIHAPLQSSIELLDLDNVGNDMVALLNLMDKDYSELTGQDQLSRGGNLPSRTSAEEIRDRRTLRGLRLETSVTNSRNAIKDIAFQILQHARYNLTQERLVKPFGRPSRFWNKVSPETLDTGFKLDIQVTSKDNSPPEQLRRSYIEVLRTLTNPAVLQIMQSQQIRFNFEQLIYNIMETFNRPELLNVFPGMAIPQDLEIINPGNQPNINNQNTQPETTTEIQRDNVQPQSFNPQGAGNNLQSLLNQLGGSQ